MLQRRGLLLPARHHALQQRLQWPAHLLRRRHNLCYRAGRVRNMQCVFTINLVISRPISRPDFPCPAGSAGPAPDPDNPHHNPQVSNTDLTLSLALF